MTLFPYFRPFILSLILAPIVGLYANLLPNQEQPLHNHLAEVNRQWSWATQYTEVAWAKQPIQFANDAARIQAHLLATEQVLRHHVSPTLLTESAYARRQQCLDILHDYAMAGLFPQNIYHTERTPYFIDHRQVACAVGYLMIQTGFEEVAQQISLENNNAYLCDLLVYEQVQQWATAFGFSPDELALIQPSYAPIGEYLLYSDGDGTDGTVYAMHTAPDNTLLIGGNFTTAGGLVCNNIVCRTPFGFVAFGNGVNGTVRSITAFGGDIYVGGTFSNGGSSTANLARWNGSSWSYSNVANGSAILSLHVHSGGLYAAGSFGVQRRSTTWIATGGIFNGTVNTLQSHNGFLIAGGDFTQIGSDNIARVAVFSSGNWQGIGSGLDAPVYALQVLNGELYAGGRFFNGTQAAFGLAHWDNINNQWDDLLYAPTYASGTNKGAIYTLQAHGNRLLIGGDFWLSEGKHFTFYDPANPNADNLPTISNFYGADDAIYCSAIWGEYSYVGGLLTDTWTYDGDFIDARNLMRTNVAAVEVPIQLMLQGAYDATTGQMRTTLRQYNLIPTQQPFRTLPWEYEGTESVSNSSQIPTNVVDWVLVEARSATNPAVVLDSRAAWLLNNGNVADVKGGPVRFYQLARNTTYILSVRHRNHLAVIRSVANTVPTPQLVSFNVPDFISGGTSQLAQLPNGNYALCSGDFNADGVITVSDYNCFNSQLSSINQYLSCDADLNRTVTTGDFNLYMPNTSRIGASEIRY